MVFQLMVFLVIESYGFLTMVFYHIHTSVIANNMNNYYSFLPRDNEFQRLIPQNTSNDSYQQILFTGSCLKESSFYEKIFFQEFSSIKCCSFNPDVNMAKLPFICCFISLYLSKYIAITHRKSCTNFVGRNQLEKFARRQKEILSDPGQTYR